MSSANPKNQHALKPKLRFPEFRDKPGWEKKGLEEVFDFHSTANNSRADLSNDGDTFYIHYGDIHTKFHSYVDFSKDAIPKISSKLFRNATLLENGDLIVADASEDTEGIGKAVEVRGLDNGTRAISGLHTILLRDSQKHYVEGFRGLLREIDTVKNQLQRLAVGVKVYAVSKTVLRQILLPVPLPPEQQKITACLSSLETLITAQSQKLEHLQTHKKGLMQQLFPAEGETLPKLRFPEFRGGLEWNIDVFNELVEIIDGDRGSNYPKSDEFSILGYCVFLNAKNVTKNGFRFDEVQFVSEKKDEVLRKGKLQRSDVVLTTRGSVGQFALYSEDVTYDNIRINSGMVILRIKSMKINPEYLYAFCKSEVLRNYIKNIAFGNAQQQLTVAEIKKFQIFYPDPKEQQKIANCLSSLDELMAAQKQKIELLKTHKKGLMQQLFPSPDPVHG